MDAGTIKRIDEIVAGEVARFGAGAALAVAHRGEVIHARGYGLASVELGVPVAPDTVFPIASITKPFTALAMLMLAEEGRLSLDDPLTRHLRPNPAWDGAISLRHLLNHTSGLRSYNGTTEFFETDGRLSVTRPQVLAKMYAQPQDAAPATRYGYSNTGYILLSFVIEQVTGLEFGEVLRQRIFQPAGMTDTLIMNDRVIVPRRAAGYETTRHGLAQAYFTSFTWHHGSGALASTVLDLARFDAALADGRLIDREAFDQMLEPAHLADGARYPYGLGWGVANYHGRAVHHHTGGRRGYCGELMRFPDDEVAVALLTNNSAFGFHLIACAVAREALGIDASPPPELAASESVAGVYRSADGATLRILVEGGRPRAEGALNCGLTVSASARLHAVGDPEVELRFSGLEPGCYQAVDLVNPMFAPWSFRRSE